MVVGAAADNALLAGSPLRLGLSDATNIQTWQQTKASGAQFTSPNGLPASVMYAYAGSGNFSAIQVVQQTNADANGLANGLPVAAWNFNGTNWDRNRAITSATGTTGVGIPSTGPALWDLVGTTNYVKQAGDGSGRAMVVGAAANTAAVAGNPLLIAASTANTAGNAQQLVVESA